MAKNDGKRKQKEEDLSDSQSSSSGADETDRNDENERQEEQQEEDEKPQPQEEKEKQNKKNDDDDDDVYDVIIPNSILNPVSNAEFSQIVQIDPKDASVLDFDGASGAIGRFEADPQGITLDLKGFQYRGTIHRGPTIMLLTPHNRRGTDKQQQYRIEATTDEFCTLQQTKNVMAKLNAVMVQGEMDESFRIMDDNVNTVAKSKDATDSKKENNKSDDTTKDDKQQGQSSNKKKAASNPKKRKSSTTTARSKKKRK